jgi:hypothetical protein
MTWAPIDSFYLLAGIVLAWVFLLILYVFGALDFLGRSLGGEDTTKLTYTDYQWPPNFPRPQIVDDSRPLDYDFYREIETNPAKDVSKGKLYVYINNRSVEFAKDFDPRLQLECDVLRTLREKRLYFNFVKEEKKTYLHLALERSSARIKNLTILLNLATITLEEGGYTKVAQRLKKQMQKSMIDNAGSITSNAPKITTQPAAGTPPSMTSPSDDDQDDDQGDT